MRVNFWDSCPACAPKQEREGGSLSKGCKSCLSRRSRNAKVEVYRRVVNPEFIEGPVFYPLIFLVGFGGLPDFYFGGLEGWWILVFS
jgi:hypothetical protein